MRVAAFLNGTNTFQVSSTSFTMSLSGQNLRKFGSDISKASTSVWSAVPNTEKIMKSRWAKLRGLYLFRSVWNGWSITKCEFLI